MTLKVILHDGKIEEYPNAHVNWEWDDETGSLGPNSGWRVGSTDEKGNHVSAFIRPRDFEKIEITHDESERIFETIKGIPGKDYRCFIENVRIMREAQETWYKFNGRSKGVDQVAAEKLVDEFLSEHVRKNT